ncbi:and mbr-like protein [Nannochloropsis oceanica]
MLTSFSRCLCLVLMALMVAVHGFRLPTNMAQRHHITSRFSLLKPHTRSLATMPTVVAPLRSDYLEDLPVSNKGPPVQWGALGTWVVATALQFATITAVMAFMETAFIKLNASKQVSLWVVRAFFAFMSLRSRVFSILDNSRPSVEKEERKRILKKRPSWMPPAKAFPVIWISIGVLRTIASSLIYQTTNTLLAPALLALILHLSIGDTWNTITNVEDRQGASVPSVFLVWLSVVNAVVQFYNTLPLAGKVLAPSAVWITVANVLVFSIWRLNGSEPMYPFRKREE